MNSESNGIEKKSVSVKKGTMIVLKDGSGGLGGLRLKEGSERCGVNYVETSTEVRRAYQFGLELREIEGNRTIPALMVSE